MSIPQTLANYFVAKNLGYNFKYKILYCSVTYIKTFLSES